MGSELSLRLIRWLNPNKKIRRLKTADFCLGGLYQNRFDVAAFGGICQRLIDFGDGIGGDHVADKRV